MQQGAATKIERAIRRHAKTKRAIRHSAIHEAGHAVVACVLDYGCNSATIVRNYAEGTAGCVEVPDHWDVIHRWEAERSIFHRDEDVALRARAIIWMAGREAEIELLGQCAGGDADDQYRVNLCLDSLRLPGFNEDLNKATVQYANRLRRQTRRLVKHHRATIERVAKTLIERKTLSGTEISALCRSKNAERQAEARMIEPFDGDAFLNDIAVMWSERGDFAPLIRRLRSGLIHPKIGALAAEVIGGTTKRKKQRPADSQKGPRDLLVAFMMARRVEHLDESANAAIEEVMRATGKSKRYCQTIFDSKDGKRMRAFARAIIGTAAGQRDFLRSLTAKRQKPRALTRSKLGKVA